MVKQPAMEASEFTMSNEDFPALPGPGPNSAPAVPTAPAPSVMDDLGAASAVHQQPPQGAIGTPLTSDMLQSNQD